MLLVVMTHASQHQLVCVLDRLNRRSVDAEGAAQHSEIM